MCVPAVALTAASAAMQSVGALVSGLGQMSALNQRAAAFRREGEMQNRQANIEATSGQYAESRRREALDRALGQQRVAMSASGLERSGSMADIALSSRSEGELDLEAIRFNTDLKSGNLRYQSAVSQTNARSASQAADIAGITTAIGTVMPLVSAAANPTMQNAMNLTSQSGAMNLNPLQPQFGIRPEIPRVRLGLNF